MAAFANGWLSPRDIRPGAPMRLFCLPHAGSGAAGFYRWKRLLPESIDVCPVLLPGREIRLAEPLLRDPHGLIDSLMTSTDHLLDAPYALFGHSMGALLAYDWALRIQAAGKPLPACLFVSGRDAPHLPYGHRDLHTLPDEAFLDALSQRYGSMQQAIFADPELRALFLPILRADLALVEAYRHRPGPLDCPIMAFAGTDDASVSDPGLAAWASLARASFSARRFEGDHFFHTGAGQQPLLDAIVNALDRSGKAID